MLSLLREEKKKDELISIPFALKVDFFTQKRTHSVEEAPPYFASYKVTFLYGD
jgi:hypothetical protein